MAEADRNRLLADIREAGQHIRNGRRTDALLIYHDVAKRAGTIAPVQFELGRLCEEIGDVDQAITHYRIAADEAPDNVQYLTNLGIGQLNAGFPEKALETLEAAFELDPQQPDVLHALGVYHMRRADNEKALEYLEPAAKLKPSHTNIRTNLAMTLMRLDRHGDALEHARKAVKLNDTDADANLALCNTLTEMGEMDEARAHLERTVRKHKTFGLAYDLLARVKKFSPADDKFIRSTEKLLDKGMPATYRYCLHYALGKMHADCRRFDEAFEHYAQANVLQKKDFDIGRDAKLLKIMKSAFTRKSIAALGAYGNPSSKPVFIVGMPRSGTTLMEQMIASHPDAAGAGELPTMPRIGGTIFPLNDKRRVAALVRDNMTPEKMQEHAQAYLDVLEQGRGDAARIVDKMPSNFYFVGLILALFPNATIIDAIRHPLDIGLSCYFQSFSDLPWANDFESIAGIYRQYRDSMQYWKSILPAGRILEVRYEQLVEDPETHGRRMLDACGLDWDPAILEHSRQKSIVKTASIAQARQPIYKSAKQRWMNYADGVADLAKLLAPYLEDERDLLLEHGIDIGSSSGGWLRRFAR